MSTVRLPIHLKTILVSLGLLVALAAAIVVSVLIGTSAADVRALFGGVAGDEVERARSILLGYRLPRTLLAAVAGGGLASAGAVFQGVLRNPLADPYLVGIAAGGALGAVVAIVLFGGHWIYSTAIFAFLGSLLAVGIVYGLAATRRGAGYVNTVILAGIIVGAFMNSLMLLILSASGSDELQRILCWLIGDLSLADYTKVAAAAACVLVGWTLIYFNANRLNLLIAGDETAAVLGLNVGRTRVYIMATAAMMTGVVVSVSGTIGFVGLVVPHAMRLLFGPDNRVLLPASLLGGGAFLAAADTVARVAAYPVELPVGVITALAGAPFFLYLLLRR